MNIHNGNKVALMVASVASMIDSFNMDNICILKELGYQVHVAANFEERNQSAERTEAFKKKLEALDVKYFHIPMPRNPLQLGAVISSYHQMVSLIKEQKYSLIHCHSPVGGVVARLAGRRARKNGTKMLYTAHGFHFFKGAPLKNWLLFYPIEKLLSKITDVLITINEEDYLRAKAFHAKTLCRISGVGVYTERFRNVSIDRREKRQQLGFSDSDYVFISVGELSRRKNHEVVIRALSRVKQDTIKYLIVGCGQLETELKQMVKDLGLEKQVVFAGYRTDVKELLHAADAFAFPSLQEGLPVALMEAMSVGMPIICSRIRGNTDLIESGAGGYLVEPRDVDGFAQAIIKTVSGEGDRMGKTNIETMKKFDICTVNMEMEKIYRGEIAQ